MLNSFLKRAIAQRWLVRRNCDHRQLQPHADAPRCIT